MDELCTITRASLTEVARRLRTGKLVGFAALGLLVPLLTTLDGPTPTEAEVLKAVEG